jgi:hypothetical protein
VFIADFNDKRILQPEPVEQCVVYDAKTGKVVHVHEAVCLGDAPRPDPEELASIALRTIAGRLEPSKLRVLHVPVGSIDRQAGARHRVNLKTMSLEALPPAKLYLTLRRWLPSPWRLLAVVIAGLCGGAIGALLVTTLLR